MCIIAIKKAGVQFPDITTVETMCDSNPDGFALVYHDTRDGKARTYRTMDREQFLRHYKSVLRSHDFRTTNLFLHARIATHGSLRRENCHGFVDKKCRLSFAHNGILYNIPNRDDLTDSETFFRDYFVPVFRHGGWFEADRLIKDVIGYSKFVFMDNKGNIRHYGNYIKDTDGVLYSNSSFRRHSYSYDLKG
jgi:predicted glutamine amidotransferase